MKWKMLFIVVALLIITVAVSAQDTAGAEIPTVTITATDDAIDAPSEVSAGFVNFTFENNRAEAAYSPVLARLNDGVTMEDLGAAMSGDNPMAALSLLTLYGGGNVASGGSLSYTVDLTAGNYLLLEFDESGASPSEPKMFTVAEGDMESMAAPESDVTLALVDFAFGVPAFISSGSHTWHLENVGSQPHEIIMIPLPEGIASVADVRAAMASENQPNIQPVFYWAAMSPGTNAWTTLDLDPGNYVLLCFFPDVNGDMAPHINHGMMQVFTVE